MSLPQHRQRVHSERLMSYRQQRVHSHMLMSYRQQHVHSQRLMAYRQQHVHSQRLMSYRQQHVHSQRLIPYRQQHVHSQMLMSSVCSTHRRPPERTSGPSPAWPEPSARDTGSIYLTPYKTYGCTIQVMAERLACELEQPWPGK